MKECWVCGLQVQPNKRRMNCVHCQGAVITPETTPKRDKNELSFRDIERMMSSHDTYERRGGKVKQRRRGG